MSKLKEIQRRDFLKFLGLGSMATTTPFMALADCIVNGLVNKAYAQSAGITPRKLLYIQLPGAPQRWTYDLFLNPKNSNLFHPNRQVNTRYIESGGRFLDAEYATTIVNGIHVPTIWGESIPTPGGGSAPMANLLNNLLAIQGLNAGSASHRASRNNVFAPLGSLRSLGALSADYSNAPIMSAAVRVSNNLFKSTKGYQPVAVGTGSAQSNLISRLLDPFKDESGTVFQNQRSVLQQVLEAATQSVAAKSELEHRGIASVEADRRSAQDLLATSFNDLGTFWTAGRNKYINLISAALGQSLAGINSSPIGSPLNIDQRGVAYQFGSNDANKVDITFPDLRSMISNRGINQLAEQFTLAEYVFANDLTHSMAINPVPLSIDLSNGQQTTIFVDEHRTGYMVSLLLNTVHWHAFSACLYELIESLKRAPGNQFNNTVIAMAGDFARSPQTGGGGSDHGQYASHFTYYSGIINGPMVLGEMQRGSVAGNHNGSWGEGTDPNRDYGTALVTTAALLGVPSPLTARNSMVAVDGDTVTAIAEESDIVT